jgi:hypothetical protein
MNVLVGVFFFGGFIGVVLGSVWRKTSKPTIKFAIALIGAAITGAPFAFLQGLGAEIWMYPVGIVAGLFWSRLGDVRNAIAKGRASVGDSAWYVAIAEAVLVVAATLGAILFAANGGQFPGLSSDRSEVRAIESKEMPCRLAWVFLGKYSNRSGQYQDPAAFRYPDVSGPRSPIPTGGDKIVISSARNMLITDYRDSSAEEKCDKMLVPPEGYRPETASQYIAGRIESDRMVLVHEIVSLPAPDAEPTYVWALIGPPK